eukprot:scaffold93009_cov60-Phaeocystis_antarctica.AAC.5
MLSVTGPREARDGGERLARRRGGHVECVVRALAAHVDAAAAADGAALGQPHRLGRGKQPDVDARPRRVLLPRIDAGVLVERRLEVKVHAAEARRLERGEGARRALLLGQARLE